MDKQIERFASFCMFYDVRGNISPHPPPLPKHLTFSLMLGFCAWKQIGYNSAHPRLYVDTKETMSRGGGGGGGATKMYFWALFTKWLMDYIGWKEVVRSLMRFFFLR